MSPLNTVAIVSNTRASGITFCGLPLMNFSPSVYPGDALCVGAGTPTPEPLLSRNNVTGAKQHVGLRGLRHRTGIPETMQPFFGCG
ncbi:Hypothetical protein SMAX5B_001692 [Scophthalmus maximus]|uniref:Uncharacterized protein n=1 Tax=Scophthalmus maximus TaxID=52904 RepID=A0A2U9CWI7_SCOMX|nr:Hypothetical protein SMAX5B_001692 [Scophthalmus maximus]